MRLAETECVLRAGCQAAQKRPGTAVAAAPVVLAAGDIVEVDIVEVDIVDGAVVAPELEWVLEESRPLRSYQTTPL